MAHALPGGIEPRRHVVDDLRLQRRLWPGLPVFARAKGFSHEVTRTTLYRGEEHKITNTVSYPPDTQTYDIERQSEDLVQIVLGIVVRTARSREIRICRQQSTSRPTVS